MDVGYYLSERSHKGGEFFYLYLISDLFSRDIDGWEVWDKRHRVYEAAKAAHPERWNGRATRDWSVDNVVYLNPEHKPEKVDLAI